MPAPASNANRIASSVPDFDVPDVSQDPVPDAGGRSASHWPDAAARATDPYVPGDASVIVPAQGWGEARPPTTGLALLQILACSGYPTQLLAMVLLTLVGVLPASSPDDWTLGYVGTLLVIDSVVVVGLVVLFLRLHGDRPMDVFLGTRTVRGEVVRGMLLVPVVFAMVALLAIVVQRYAPWLHQEVNPFQTLIRTPHGMLVVGALSILVGGLREEIQRAFVLHRFTQIGTPVLGLIVFSLLFGLGHVVQGWDAVIMTAVLGATWGIVYLRRRSIVAPVVCHAAFDVIQVATLGLLST
jgi:membrane protease YdiL (CAAX protease family)